MICAWFTDKGGTNKSTRLALPYAREREPAATSLCVYGPEHVLTLPQTQHPSRAYTYVPYTHIPYRIYRLTELHPPVCCCCREGGGVGVSLANAKFCIFKLNFHDTCCCGLPWGWADFRTHLQKCNIFFIFLSMMCLRGYFNRKCSQRERNQKFKTSIRR